MEVHFTVETEKKLKELAAQSGRGTDDLVEDAMAAYLDEVRQIRETLDGRCALTLTRLQRSPFGWSR
jgi:predicted DNA-binding protein